MNKLLKFAAPLAVVAALAFAPAPAHAQFGGGDDQMTQFAPMLEMMKAKMGKQRFGQLMQTMGPMMENMGGSGGGFGGGGFSSFGGGDMSGMMGMLTQPETMGALMGMIGTSGKTGRRVKKSRNHS